ncbi:MAG: SURF1 family protein [Propionibacteriaceae bacterium]
MLSSGPLVFRQAGVLLLGSLLAAAMVVLGIWQLDVYRAQGNQVAADRAAEPPVALASVATAGSTVGDGYGRTVAFTGTYDPALQLLIRDPAGGPSRVLSGLTLADRSVLPVVRGTVPATTAHPPAPPAGTVQEAGVFLPSESTSGGPVAVNGPHDSNDPAAPTSIQLAVVAQSWSPPLIPGFVTLDAADAEAQGLSAATAELPESKGRLRNAAYALQWWVFAAFALAMAGKMVRDMAQADDYALLEGVEDTPAEETPPDAVTRLSQQADGSPAAP